MALQAPSKKEAGNSDKLIPKEKENRWRSITPEELAMHSDVDKNDAWICIKGIVYDVSAYAEHHPGGIEKIKKYAGKDATATFDVVHSYVDFKAILGDHQLGILKGHPDAPRRNFCSKIRREFCLGKRYSSPVGYFKQDSVIAIYVLDFPMFGRETDMSAGVTDKRLLHILKIVDAKMAWLCKYELPQTLANDELILETDGKGYQHVEITLRKPVPGYWAKQMHVLRNEGRFVPIHEPYVKFDACIIYKKCLTPNILMFGIQLTSAARIHVPIGFHVEMTIGNLSRPYTPVCLHIIDPDEHADHKHNKKHVESSPQVLYFMIKIYKNGALTSALDKIEEDEGLDVPVLQISTPYGYFDEDNIKDFAVLLLICGGSGISPMIRIIQSFYHQKDRFRGKRVGLIYFGQKDYDLVWKKAFHELHEATNWFYYFPVLTQPSKYCAWEGLTGRITPQLVLKVLEEIPQDKKCVKKACICGPPGFNISSVNALKDIVKPQNMHVFTHRK